VNLRNLHLFVASRDFLWLTRHSLARAQGRDNALRSMAVPALDADVRAATVLFPVCQRSFDFGRQIGRRRIDQPVAAVRDGDGPLGWGGRSDRGRPKKTFLPVSLGGHVAPYDSAEEVGEMRSARSPTLQNEGKRQYFFNGGTTSVSSGRFFSGIFRESHRDIRHLPPTLSSRYS
jgi:hypothetical protein